MDIRSLQQKRAKLAGDARAILDAVPAGEELSAEDSQRFDALMDEADQLDGQIAREKRQRELDSRIADDDPDDPDPEPGDPADPAEVARQAFGRYLAHGERGLTEEQARALQITPDEQGGHLVAPQQFVEQLIKFVDDMVHIRGLATTMTLTEGESLGAPSLDTDVSDFDWTTELGTGTEDSDMKFGKRELRPHPLAKRIKVSRTLLRRGSMSPETIVRDRLGYKVGVTQEKAYMTGDGAQKPLGLFVASAQGIPTARDSAIGAAGAIPATTATADQLIDAKYTLKEQYWRTARWLFHRDIIKVVRKIKDSDGQYVWAPGLAGGRPDTILELPYVVSEFAPNTISATAYVGMVGAFEHYWIVDSLEFEIQRLVELYAETNQVGFIGRYEGDGMPVLSEAFVRLQVA